MPPACTQTSTSAGPCTAGHDGWHIFDLTKLRHHLNMVVSVFANQHHGQMVSKQAPGTYIIDLQSLSTAMCCLQHSRGPQLCRSRDQAALGPGKCSKPVGCSLGSPCRRGAIRFGGQATGLGHVLCTLPLPMCKPSLLQVSTGIACGMGPAVFLCST
jgi:hypothetical protein